MGIYVITIPSAANLPARLTETSRLKLAVDNTYSVGNEYRNQELFLSDSTTTDLTVLNGTIIYSIKNSLYYWIGWSFGGLNRLFTLEKESDSWNFVKTVSNHPRMTGNPNAFIYASKADKYYAMGSAIGEYDNNFVPTQKGYNFALADSSYAYDSKRNYIICNSVRPDGGGNRWLTQLLLDSPTTDEGPLLNQFARNHLALMTNNRIKFLTYSSFDDNYYFTDVFSIVRISAETGGGQAVVQKGTNMLGLMIEEGSSFGYYAYQDVNDVKISKFHLTNYSDVYPIVNLGNISNFVFLYVGKVVLINYKKTDLDVHWSTIAYNTDLTLDLTYEKNLYHVKTGTTSYHSRVAHNMYQSLTSPTKYYINSNPSQVVRPLSNDEVNIHIPVQIGGLGNPFRTTSHMQNINPVTPYPTVTTPAALVDCCLDELKCDINTKLASKSCEVTNRAIVGKHYGGMADDSELLEALLWITTFDCLTCDEIEKLRCITSKI
tara:strand:+ start:21174 stop:22643 length:1470 start_codon:yes stop_codon:yes gene_type:complete